MSAGGGTPALSVVVPSRNGAARLPETLEAVAAQELVGDVEVLVVDDGSSDGTERIARAAVLPWGAARVVRHDAARGRAAACNSGIEAARAEIVVLLDDDMTLETGALDAHRRFHGSHPLTAARGRVALDRTASDSCFRRFLYREEAFEAQRLTENADDLPFPLCLTGHFSAPRRVLVEAGGFDTSITRYGFEDIELGYRLSRRGVRIRYLPEASARHRAYATSLDLYLERHLEVGLVARQLAARHPEGPFREYLRVDAPRKLGFGRDPAGLVALRVSNRLLLRAPVRRLLGSRAGFAMLRSVLGTAEILGLDRVAHFGYHVARDLRYFQGYFSGTRADAPSDRGSDPEAGSCTFDP